MPEKVLNKCISRRKGRLEKLLGEINELIVKWPDWTKKKESGVKMGHWVRFVYTLLRRVNGIRLTLRRWDNFTFQSNMARITLPWWPFVVEADNVYRVLSLLGQTWTVSYKWLKTRFNQRSCTEKWDTGTRRKVLKSKILTTKVVRTSWSQLQICSHFEICPKLRLSSDTAKWGWATARLQLWQLYCDHYDIVTITYTTNQIFLNRTKWVKSFLILYSD